MQLFQVFCVLCGVVLKLLLVSQAVAAELAKAARERRTGFVEQLDTRTPEMVEAIFETFDLDGDGYLNRQEHKELLKALGQWNFGYQVCSHCA